MPSLQNDFGLYPTQRYRLFVLRSLFCVVQATGLLVFNIMNAVLDVFESASKELNVDARVLQVGAGVVAAGLVYKLFFSKRKAKAYAAKLEDSYDFIVVGAGSSGCVVASRLSEDPNVSVLLVEAGKDNHRGLFVRVPALVALTQLTSYDWKFKTETQPNCGNRVINWPRGKIMGGSSCLNYMIAVRCDSKNYDRWEKMGCKGWSYKDVLPYFKKLECVESPKLLQESNGLRGTNGPIHVTNLEDTNFGTKEVVSRFVDGCNTVLGTTKGDYNGKEFARASFAQLNVKQFGGRQDAATAYLVERGALERPNLKVLTEATVAKVNIDERSARATGITVLENNGKKSRVILARKEVILSAGAVGTPTILLHSGVGPRKHLESLGISVKKDLPVGENLMDHIMTIVSIGFKSFNNGFYALGLYDNLSAIFHYLLGSEKSLFFWSPLQGTACAHSGINPKEHGCDMQLQMLPCLLHDPQVAINGGLEHERYMQGSFLPRNGMAVAPSLILPKSVGYVRLRSKDPMDPPMIQPNYLSHPDDTKVLVEAYRLLLKSLETPAWKDAGAYEIKDPNNPYELGTEDYMRRHIQKFGVTIYHPVGTAKMGAESDPTSVVNPRLQVKGIHGLRCIDASIMPVIVSGNTNFPCLMIGEKGAAMVAEDHNLNLQRD